MVSSLPADRAQLAWQALYEAVLAEHEERMQSVAELGTTPGELKALLRLQADGQVTAGELARAWNNDPSTTTWLIDRLEKRGLVERRQSETDRRVKHVVLTDRGREVRAQVTAALHRPPTAFLSADPVLLEAAQHVTQAIRRP